MKPKAFFIYLIAFILLTACSNRPDGVLDRSDMKEFLVELHLLDGVLATKPPGNIQREKEYYYNALMRKHGITQADFDSSLVYYASKPKSFERMYTQVVKQLEDFELQLKSDTIRQLLPDTLLKVPSSYELWSLDSSYVYTPDSSWNDLAFSIKDTALLTGDTYRLFLRMRRAPADSSANARIALRIHYADGTIDSLTQSVKNDSVLRRYRFNFQVSRNLKIDSLSGFLLGADRRAGTPSVHIDSISLKRFYLPAYQDSLRSQLDTLKTTIKPAPVDSPAINKAKPPTHRRMERIQLER